MSHDTPTITAKKRDRVGTRYAQRLRNAGQLPGVIYGHKTDPMAISLDHKELLGHLKGGSHVINVEVEGGPNETCLVKDLQFGYLGDNLIHIDFARVDLNEEVTVHVHIHYVGEAAAAKAAGAILSHDLTELEIICKVSAIPDEIRVDLGAMEGETLTVGEIELPPGVSTPLDAGTRATHVTIVQEEAEGEETEVSAEGASPEVITESKKDEESSD